MGKHTEYTIKSHMPRRYAMAVARRIAAVLREHGATKVLLFGSLCTPKYDPDYSDIDLYYEGIPPKDTIHAEVEATWKTGEEDETGRRRVDLVHGRVPNPKLKRIIFASGVPL